MSEEAIEKNLFVNPLKTENMNILWIATLLTNLLNSCLVI